MFSLSWHGKEKAVTNLIFYQLQRFFIFSMPFLFTCFCFTLLQEGLIVVENTTAGIISGTRKLHVRRKGSNLHALNQVTNSSGHWQPSQKQADQETQLKVSCDLRWQICITGSGSLNNKSASLYSRPCAIDQMNYLVLSLGLGQLVWPGTKLTANNVNYLSWLTMPFYSSITGLLSNFAFNTRRIF